MGNFCCSECSKPPKIKKPNTNEGENFIREVINATKLHNYTIKELHKLLFNAELFEFEEIEEKNYYHDVTYYSNFAFKYLYDKNPKTNKFYQIHSILFSFIASTFQHSITKIDGINVLKAFLIFSKSSIDEKIKYFYIFTKKLINKKKIFGVSNKYNYGLFKIFTERFNI